MDLPALPTGIDWSAFAAAVRRPRRPRLDEAVAAARELVAERRRVPPRNPAERFPRPAQGDAIWLTRPAFLDEAWETLATRLDGEWLAESSARGARAFLPFVPLRAIDYDRDRRPEGRDAPRYRAARPYDLETMVALMAADRDDLATAEAVALEACRRLAPWGGAVATKVCWARVTESWPGAAWSSAFEAPASAATIAEDVATSAGNRTVVFRSTSYWKQPRRAALARAEAHAQAWAAWRRGVAEGRRVTWRMYDRSFPLDLEGYRFADLPDPLDPLLCVWGLGYELLDVRGDCAVLGVSLPSDLPAITGLTHAAVRNEARRNFGAWL